MGTLNWQNDVREKISSLLELLSSPDLDSTVPLYIREMIDTNLSGLLRQTLDENEFRGVLRGAFRTLNDAGGCADDDSIVVALRQIYGCLPAEC